MYRNQAFLLLRMLPSQWTFGSSFHCRCSAAKIWVISKFCCCPHIRMSSPKENVPKHLAEKIVKKSWINIHLFCELHNFFFNKPFFFNIFFGYFSFAGVELWRDLAFNREDSICQERLCLCLGFLEGAGSINDLETDVLYWDRTDNPAVPLKHSVLAFARAETGQI